MSTVLLLTQPFNTDTGGTTAEQWQANTPAGDTDEGYYWNPGGGVLHPTTRRWGTPQSHVVNTVAGPSALVKIGAFNSPPLTADVTISGSITVNLYALENSMSANAGLRAEVGKFSPDGTYTSIGVGTNTTELGTASAARSISITPGSAVACNKGDMLVVRVWAIDGGGTMASGFTVTLRTSGSSGTDGDSTVTFTENFAVEGDPAYTGSQLWLTTTVSAVTGVASTDERELSAVDPGTGSSTDALTNAAAGPVAPIQYKLTTGAADKLAWYSDQLGAQTVQGPLKFVTRNFYVSPGGNGSLARLSIGYCNADGSGEVTVAHNCTGPMIGSNTISLPDDRNLWRLPFDDFTISAGQRLVFKVWMDDRYLWITGVSGGMGGAATFHLLLNHSNTYVLFRGALVGYSAPLPSMPPLPRTRRADMAHLLRR